jgi:hypothetical protein
MFFVIYQLIKEDENSGTYVQRRWQIRTKFCPENQEKRPRGDLDVDGSVILNETSEKQIWGYELH